MTAKAFLRKSPRTSVRQRTQYSSNSFLSPKCVARRVGEKGGHSVYAAEPIRKGELLVVWSGKLVDEATLGGLPPSVRRYSLQVEEDQFLVSLTDCEPADYVNHSCEPNAGLRGQIALVAMRDIAVDEEITYDYAMSDGSGYDEFECQCGSSLCRHWVGSQDWTIRELWARYDGYFSPYIAHRIAKLEMQEAISSRTVAFRDVASLTSPAT